MPFYLVCRCQVYIQWRPGICVYTCIRLYTCLKKSASATIYNIWVYIYYAPLLIHQTWYHPTISETPKAPCANGHHLGFKMAPAEASHLCTLPIYTWNPPDPQVKHIAKKTTWYILWDTLNVCGVIYVPPVNISNIVRCKVLICVSLVQKQHSQAVGASKT